MEFCLVMKVRKHSPEIGGKKRKDSVRGAGLPSLSLVSWAASSMHLPFIAPAAETWILLIGGDHYKKDTKNIKEIDHSFFEMLKPGHNSTSFSISTFECKTGANIPSGSRTVQQRDLCWERKQNCTMKSPESSGSEKLGSCAPLFCQSFSITHGTCHLTSQCLSSSI